MSSFSFKTGVETKRVHPKMVKAWAVIAQLSAEWNIDTVVTSVADGNHMTGSFHYKDPVQATDFRTWYLPTDRQKEEFCEQLKGRLGPDYDVVLESTHLHVEYDPK